MQGGGAGGEDADTGKGVGRDLEHQRRVGETVHLVQKQRPAPGVFTEKGFWIGEPALDGRQVAVEIVAVANLMAERGLADAADTGEPYDRPFTP